MKKIVFIVEKTHTGYSAYAEDFDKLSVGTTGASLADLRTNIVDATNALKEYQEVPLISSDDITIRFDLPQFFEFYKEINAKALSKRIGLNQTLLSQYVNGKKIPSEKQVQKIMNGIKDLGKELVGLELV